MAKTFRHVETCKDIAELLPLKWFFFFFLEDRCNNGFHHFHFKLTALLSVGSMYFHKTQIHVEIDFNILNQEREKRWFLSNYSVYITNKYWKRNSLKLGKAGKKLWRNDMAEFDIFFKWLSYLFTAVCFYQV